MTKYNYPVLVPYIVFTVILSAIYYAVMSPALPLPMFERLCDSLIYGILSGILTFLLHVIIKYGRYSDLPAAQAIANYAALAVLFVGLSAGLSYAILLLLFPPDVAAAVLPLLPLRLFIAFLLFCTLALSCDFMTKNRDFEDIIDEPAINSGAATTEEASSEELLERIAVKNGQKIDVASISEIFLLQAEGDYVMIHSSKGKFLKEETMKYFEAHLPPSKFVRVHRSSIINVDYISRVELYDKQSQLVRLQNNMQVKMSIAGYKQLKAALGL
jgi:hypothetical protein